MPRKMAKGEDIVPVVGDQRRQSRFVSIVTEPAPAFYRVRTIGARDGATHEADALFDRLEPAAQAVVCGFVHQVNLSGYGGQSEFPADHWRVKPLGIESNEEFRAGPFPEESVEVPSANKRPQPGSPQCRDTGDARAPRHSIGFDIVVNGIVRETPQGADAMSGRQSSREPFRESEPGGDLELREGFADAGGVRRGEEALGLFGQLPAGEDAGPPKPDLRLGRNAGKKT